jgi:hypothetical protein
MGRVGSSPAIGWSLPSCSLCLCLCPDLDLDLVPVSGCCWAGPLRRAACASRADHMQVMLSWHCLSGRMVTYQLQLAEQGVQYLPLGIITEARTALLNIGSSTALCLYQFSSSLTPIVHPKTIASNHLPKQKRMRIYSSLHITYMRNIFEMNVSVSCFLYSSRIGMPTF